MRLLRVFPVLLIFLGALLLFERPAYGYADPGTGLLAIQAAGSALVAAGWYLRRRIYSLFYGNPASQPVPDAHSSVPASEDQANP